MTWPGAKHVAVASKLAYFEVNCAPWHFAMSMAFSAIGFGFVLVRLLTLPLILARRIVPLATQLRTMGWCSVTPQQGVVVCMLFLPVLCCLSAFAWFKAQVPHR